MHLNLVTCLCRGRGGKIHRNPALWTCPVSGGIKICLEREVDKPARYSMLFASFTPAYNRGQAKARE